MSEITGVNYVMKLSNVQDRRSIARSTDIVFSNLNKWRRKLKWTGRKMSKKNKKGGSEIDCGIYEGRGRTLKCEEFPYLPTILEFAFGNQDRINSAGGGLESHQRLIDLVLYPAADSSTIMRQARKTVLTLAFKDFKISLSCYFNYTHNYREGNIEGTYQAKRHHDGKGVNAWLSLHKPPRTGVEKLVVNLQWTTHNVNFKLDL